MTYPTSYFIKRLSIPDPEPDILKSLEHYLDCALWASTDEDIYDVTDFANEAVQQAYEDLENAIGLANETAPGWDDYWDLEQFGHDFFLTRNGHGAGFWDRAPSNDKHHTQIGEALTKIAKSFGTADVYSDNKQLYFY